MFDLERAIKAWKKDLAGNPALEDTYISELESVLRDEVADLVRRGENEEEAFRRASSEMGDVADIGAEFSKVRPPYRRLNPKGKRPLFIPALIWSYVRISLRKIQLQKGYSFINIAGLAVGLACSILMMLWVWDELSFDRFHVNRNSLYRIITEVETETGTLLDARTPTPLGPAIAAEIPEVLDVCRYQGNEWYGISLEEKSFFDVIVGIGEPSFFKMFTFPLLKGNPDTALAEPRSIVITESLARRFFGDEDPMGKILMLPAGHGDAYTVTGLMRDTPENSHFYFDCMIPASNMHKYHHVDFENWDSTFFYHYVQLTPNASPAEAAMKMTQLVNKKKDSAEIALRLQPLKDVHLKSNFAFDSDNNAQGSLATLTIFSIAAVAILLLACINFMNLSTARSANRGKEVGLRKVTGARRSDIIKQFLGESVVISFISLFLALLLVWQALPFFNTLAGKHLSLIRVFDPGKFLVFLGITLLTGIFAGSYPAFFLSSFHPARVLRGGWFSASLGQSRLRKGLVVFQFALTAFFVIGTVVVDKQLRFVRSKNLGIDTQYVLATESPPRTGYAEALLADPGVIGISQSMPPGYEIRGTSDIFWDGKDPEDLNQFFPARVDPHYLSIFHLEMAEGRFFSEEMTTDRTDAAVLNETAAKAMGFDSPIGRRISLRMMNGRGAMEDRSYNVIGVMKDFHQNSLHRPIDPIIFIDEGGYPWLNVRIRPENVGETIKSIEKTWKSFIPNRPFEYEFLDDRIDGFYKQEVSIKSVLGLFAILALFTACLGLFGLASFITEKRTKEIGIRKVLGATIGELIKIQTREFAVWVLMANAIAWPLAYYAAGRWLREFAYRIRPGIEPAVLAALFSLSVALLSVAYKAVRAARANPVDSLKYE